MHILRLTTPLTFDLALVLLFICGCACFVLFFLIADENSSEYTTDLLLSQSHFWRLKKYIPFAYWRHFAKIQRGKPDHHLRRGKRIDNR